MDVKKLEPNQQRVMELATRLGGMSYHEWLKLQMVINRSFDKQKREQERALQLASAEELAEIIAIHF